MTIREEEYSSEAGDYSNQQTFSLYENRRGLMDYIGRTAADDVLEAFRIIIARRYKIDTEIERVDCGELENGSYQIWFRETEYVVKRK